ncbi:MAG: hypothetical protein DRQ51_08700 [Gammaproteobacteria bacterium]|nr:MAG: hypothetical protein DRQ51_08700 [Gammaproteobacteria bacterium]
MSDLQKIDISVLPKSAQQELSDFFVTLRHRYGISKKHKTYKNKQYQDDVIMQLQNYIHKQNIQVDKNINIRSLIDETHNRII